MGNCSGCVWPRSRETGRASAPARRCRPGRRPAASRASVCCQRTAMQPEHGGPGGQTSTAGSTSCSHSATRRPVYPASISAPLTRCSRPSRTQVARSARGPTLPVTAAPRAPRPGRSHLGHPVPLRVVAMAGPGAWGDTSEGGRPGPLAGGERTPPRRPRPGRSSLRGRQTRRTTRRPTRRHRSIKILIHRS